MSENKQPEIKDYAGGWITERTGTDVPVFLKFAFGVIGFGCMAYLFVFMNGEITHSERGVLVQEFNRTTGTADSFMLMVLAIGVIYCLLLLMFAWRKFHEE